ARSMPDLDALRHATSEQLMARRLQHARSLLLSYRQQSGRLPWDLAEQLSALSMVLGSPGIGLEQGAIEGNLDETRLLVHRGTAQIVMGRLRSSIEIYEAAVRLDSQNATAHFGLARAYLELGDAARSRLYCQRALELAESDDYEMRHNLQWIAFLVGAER